MAKRKTRVSDALQALTSVDTGDLVGGIASQQTLRRRSTVQVPIEVISPDKYQPRPLLPFHLKERLEEGALAVGRAWLEEAKLDPLTRAQIDDLIQLGRSCHEHGQIKPVTGYWQGERFILETGERRFWGIVLDYLNAGRQAPPTIEALVVPSPSRVRQVIENEHTEPPSAVMRAREIAGILLEMSGVQPDDSDNDSSYYAKALSFSFSLEQRQAVADLLGISTRSVYLYLSLLRLPPHLIRVADRHRLALRDLVKVVRLPPNEWERAIDRLIAKGNPRRRLQSRDHIERISHHGSKWAKMLKRLPDNAEARKVALEGIARRLASSLTEEEKKRVSEDFRLLGEFLGKD